MVGQQVVGQQVRSPDMSCPGHRHNQKGHEVNRNLCTEQQLNTLPQLLHTQHTTKPLNISIHGIYLFPFNIVLLRFSEELRLKCVVKSS